MRDRKREHRIQTLTKLPLTFALACGMLSACSVGPNFEEPKTEAPASWASKGDKSGHDEVSETVTAPVQPEWWAAFNDPELTSLEKRVAAQNLDVRIATARLAESRAQRTVSGADELPSATGNTSYTRERPSAKGIFGLFSGGSSGGSSGSSSGGGSGSSGGSAGGGLGGASGLPVATAIKPFDLYQYGFDASWELDLWGRVRRSVESADASLEASTEARRDTLLSMMAEVARDYIQLRGNQVQLQLAHETLQSVSENLRLTRERAMAGLTSQLDVSDAASQVDTVSSDVPQLEQQAAQLVDQLGFLLGANPGALAKELETPAPVPPVPPQVPIGLPSELARRRPDIREAEAQLHAATAEIGVAKAAFYPSVTLTGSFDLQALRLQDLGNWAARTYTVGPSISIPIFEGRRLTGTLQLRTASQQEALFNYQRTVLNAWQEVDTSLTAYEKEQHRRARLAAAVDDNRQALALAQDQYRRGFVTFLNVLSAEQRLYSSQQQEATSTATVSSNLVSLYKALGGGWETAFPREETAAVSPAPQP